MVDLDQNRISSAEDLSFCGIEDLDNIILPENLPFHELCQAIENCLSKSHSPPTKNLGFSAKEQVRLESNYASGVSLVPNFSRTRIIAPSRTRNGEPIGTKQIIRGFSDIQKTAPKHSRDSDTAQFSIVKSHNSSRDLQGLSEQTGVPVRRPVDRNLPLRPETLSASSSEHNRAQDGSHESSLYPPIESRIEPRKTKSVMYESVDPKSYLQQRIATDPVKRYREYQRYWAENPIPGENPHHQLRWNIRAMLLKKDYETGQPGTKTMFQKPSTFCYEQSPLEGYMMGSSASSSGNSSHHDSNSSWTPPPPSRLFSDFIPRK